jgi:AcrR family transcriptional regulator
VPACSSGIPRLLVSKYNETASLVKAHQFGYDHGMIDTTRPRAGRKRSEKTRLDILDAAVGLLHARSYGELTIDAIASEAGVGKQTIYRWWNNKADVVLEALTERASTINPPETYSLEADVAGFFEATVGLLRGKSRSARGTAAALKGLMAEAQLDPAFSRRFRDFIEIRRTALRSVLSRHARAGRHSAKAATQLDALVDMLFGALWYRLLLGHAPLDTSFTTALAALAARALD